jgi:hypothetical protein
MVSISMLVTGEVEAIDNEVVDGGAGGVELDAS